MRISRSSKPQNKVDYFALPNGFADVFMRRNEITETDDEGNVNYVSEEVYFQIDKSVTKQQIEDNFDLMWNDAVNVPVELTTDEKVEEVNKNIVLLADENANLIFQNAMQDMNIQSLQDENAELMFKIAMIEMGGNA
ncbi:hypothetical protein [Schinkia azotoformans]|uniref:hypothetical protein n=1 Tax=Schinkia azotoformans TaxID=1454 RepID=UPI002DBFE6D8|nr:hypothetical protein [Schinkia azotoformans]MEC1778395.1 hypothetical protein [Schinkia azotoformans]MED4328360.1 hypothetical protein [Schinkia azotoformans]